MDSLTALIVDDDTDFRGSMALLVEREGFIVREADSVNSARARLAEAPSDVVLADLSLPDGDGLDLMADETVSKAQTQFVVITGNASLDSAVVALRKGALDYLTKPVDRGVDARVARDHDELRLRLRHRLVGHQVEAVPVGQAEVGEHDVGRGLGEACAPGADGVRLADDEALALHEERHASAEVGVVVDDERGE